MPELDAMLALALQGPTGDTDSAWHVGIIQSWDDVSGVNTVLVNGVFIPNMKSLISGIGSAYKKGDNVIILRKQTQYVIMGKVQSAGVTSGTSPQYKDGAGGLISGTTGTWRDLDNPALSPTLTTRLGTNQNMLLTWGSSEVVTENSTLEMGFQISGAFAWAPGNFQGTTTRSTTDSGSAAPSTASSAPHNKSLILRSGGGGPGQIVLPGVITISLKYRLSLFNTGVSARVGTPWIQAIPF